MTTAATPVDDFEAAKAVFEKLKDLPAERQERVLRWVAEGLGVSLASSGGSGAGLPTNLPPSAPGIVAPATGVAPKDIKSFIAEKKPRSDNQFAAAVAYYYRFEAPPAQRRDTIDATVLQEATRLAGRPRLANPRFTLNNAKNQGYLDASARGEYLVNTVGENLIVMTLPGDGSTARGRSPKPKKATKRSHAMRPKKTSRARD